MSAFLVPSSGGDAIPLRRSRVYLGRSKEVDRALPAGRETALFMLELHDGWWFIEDLRCPDGMRINGAVCKRQKLAPNDEIEVGKQRFLINYETPKYRFGRRSDGEFQAIAPQKKSSPAPVAVPAANGVLGRLVPLGGGPDLALRKVRLTLGRRAPCDLIIERGTVSSKHCEFEFVEGHWFVRDLGSRNGTRIDGQKVDEGWILPNGRVTIGDQRYQLEYVAVGPQPLGAVAVRTDRSLMEQIGLGEKELEKAIPREELDPEEANRKRWTLEDGF
ncbi:MAG: FHA domain-containing protein [Planctomycetaceae bacterium]